MAHRKAVLSHSEGKESDRLGSWDWYIRGRYIPALTLDRIEWHGHLTHTWNRQRSMSEILLEGTKDPKPKPKPQTFKSQATQDLTLRDTWYLRHLESDR